MLERKEEGRRPHEVILSEWDHGSLSIETGLVKQGEKLEAGTVLMFDGTKLVAHNGVLDTLGDVDQPVAGILLDNVDASETGHNADTPAVYLARLAEVKDGLVIYPTESTEGGEKAAVIRSLATLFIRPR